jgi:phosphoglycolate phosphatase
MKTDKKNFKLSAEEQPMSFIFKPRNLIWDFNGTLLNDLGLCVESINILLINRGLDPLPASRYLDIFTFPVKDYYSMAGFDFKKEQYETVAMQFMELYLNGVNKVDLHQHAVSLLSQTQNDGYRQIILSAMEINELQKLAINLGIKDYFEDIFGIDNHMAAGKKDLASHTLAKTGFIPGETLFIGDTLHDAEVAEHMGVDCVLIAQGHQSKERLSASGCRVLDSLEELAGIL